MKHVWNIQCDWVQNLDFYIFSDLGDLKTCSMLFFFLPSENAWAPSVFTLNSLSDSSVSFTSRVKISACSAFCCAPRQTRENQRAATTRGRRDGHHARGPPVGLCWLTYSGEGCVTEKKMEILTSTLDTFRKKLLCRCLVLVFTTVRFQSAMLGKCFSLSQQHNVLQ